MLFLMLFLKRGLLPDFKHEALRRLLANRELSFPLAFNYFISKRVFHQVPAA